MITTGVWSLGLLGFSGCLYLHDDARAKSTRDLRDQFARFQTNSGNVYDVMLTNLANVEQEGAFHLGLDAELRGRTHVTALLKTGIATLWTNLLDATKTNSLLEKEFEESGVALAAKHLKVEGQIDDATKLVAAIKKKVTDAEAEKDKWEARQLFFRGILEFYTGNATNLGKLDKKALEQAKQTIWDRKIGSVTVGSVIGSDFKDLKHLDIAGIGKGATIDLFDPSKAPGITVQILSLGEDLAGIQLEKAKADLAYIEELQGSLDTRRKLLNDMASYINQSTNLLERFIRSGLVARDETILQVIQKFQTTKDEGNLHAFLVLLLQTSTASTIDQSLLRGFNTKPEIIRHEYSIKVSRLNAREREAVIARGMESLVHYYDEGLKPEDLANLAHAAEAAGIAVIGAKIN